jgi:hypothetical protein
MAARDPCFRETLRDPAQRQSFVQQPLVHLANPRCFVLIDDGLAAAAIRMAHVAVTEGSRSPQQHFALPRFVQAAPASALQNLRTLVFGDRTLHVQQQLIFGSCRDRAFDEGYFHAVLLELLKKDPLVYVAACQAVGASEYDHVDLSLSRRVAQAVESRAIQPSAADAVIGEDVALIKRPAALLNERPQLIQLTGNRLLLFLASAGHSRVDGSSHDCCSALRRLTRINNSATSRRRGFIQRPSTRSLRTSSGIHDRRRERFVVELCALCDSGPLVDILQDSPLVATQSRAARISLVPAPTYLQSAFQPENLLLCDQSIEILEWYVADHGDAAAA